METATTSDSASNPPPPDKAKSPKSEFQIPWALGTILLTLFGMGVADHLCLRATIESSAELRDFLPGGLWRARSEYERGATHTFYLLEGPRHGDALECEPIGCSTTSLRLWRSGSKAELRVVSEDGTIGNIGMDPTNLSQEQCDILARHVFFPHLFLPTSTVRPTHVERTSNGGCLFTLP